MDAGAPGGDGNDLWRKAPDQIIETGSAGEWVLSASDLVEIEALIGDVRLSDG